jgi:protein TonB
MPLPASVRSRAISSGFHGCRCRSNFSPNASSLFRRDGRRQYSPTAAGPRFKHRACGSLRRAFTYGSRPDRLDSANATHPSRLNTLASTYRLRSPLDETPLHRRASGVALALGFNLLLLLILLGIGVIPQLPKGGQAPLIVNLVTDSQSAKQSRASRARTQTPPTRKPAETKPLPKPRIVLPAKPTIVPPREPPWIEMSKSEMAAADIGRMPKAAAGGSGRGDSEEVGRGPNGEVLYAAEWARHPTDAELGGYLPRNAPDGWGLIACRTAPENRVEDCIELDQSPRGSHLASAVRQAAWQFRVRPPRKNGRPLIGSWVQIRIEYSTVGRRT